MGVETRQAIKKTKQPMVSKAVTPLSYGIHSDVDVKHDHHPHPATGGTQPHAERVDLRAGILDVALGKTFQTLHGQHSGRQRFEDTPGGGVRDVWREGQAISEPVVW